MKKDYCSFYLHQYGKTNSAIKCDIATDFSSSCLLYHFLSILDDDEIQDLNDVLNVYFGQLRAKKSVDERMYEFVKASRQGDIFHGKNAGNKDMILHTILNSSTFFEHVIFQLNNQNNG